MKLKLLVHVAFLCTIRVITEAGITGQPVSKIAFLNSTATFLCSAFESGVFWLVNDTHATNISILQRGIDSSITRRIGEDTMARLTILASANNNNTRLQCAVYTAQGERLLSDEAELKVQGLLAAPQNLKIKTLSENQNTMVLSWSPPFTLDVSNVDPAIAGYRVYTVNTNAGDQEMNPITADVTEHQFVINGQLQCHLYVFSVSAVNQVGEGDVTDPVSTSVCPGGTEGLSGVPPSPTVSAHSSHGSILNSVVPVGYGNEGFLEVSPSPTLYLPHDSILNSLVPGGYDTDSVTPNRPKTLLVIPVVVAGTLVLCATVAVLLFVVIKRHYTQHQANDVKGSKIQMKKNCAYEESQVRFKEIEVEVKYNSAYGVLPIHQP